MAYKNQEERKQLIAEQLEDLQYDFGSTCCGYNLINENDGIGLCGKCYEWSEYLSLEELCEMEDNQLFI